MNDQSTPSAGTGRTPVAVITGFLGSGKTTVLNWLIKQPEMGRTAVIVNEFGEIGIDNDLIEKSDESTILLGSGCLCCTVRGDLVETLRDLSLRRASGEIPPFERVVIETTGLAEPGAVLHALMSLPVAARYRLDTVLTTVDAVHALGTLDAHPDAVRQVAVADRVLLTKRDLVAPEQSKHVAERLLSISPSLQIIETLHGEVDVEAVLNSRMYDVATKPADVADWIGNLEASELQEAENNQHDLHHHHAHDHFENAGITAHAFTFLEPLTWEMTTAWLDTLAAKHGERILRMKAIVDIADNEKAVVLHGVQHLFHPPTQIDGFPEGKRRSRFIFITQGLDRSTIEAFLDQAKSLAAGRLRARQHTQELMPT